MSDQYCAFDGLSDDLYITGFTKYLKTYHREDILTILDDESTDSHFAINVNVLDLLQASPRLGSLLLSYPTIAIPHFNRAALNAQEDVMKEEGGNLMEYKKSVHVRLYSLPLCEETTKGSVSSIRSSDINKFVSVAGTVIKTGQFKMLEYQKTFQCSKCRKTFIVKADIEQHYVLQKPTSCAATEDCPGKSFKPVENTQVCRDYQEIKIQDKIAHLNVGSIPRSILVIFEDDLVDMCKAGDDVVITGTVMRRWKPLKADSRCTIEMVIHCNHIRINNEQKSNVNVTQETEEEFKSFWRRHSDCPLKARNLILKSMCPQLYGLYFVKLAVALTLIGGVPMLKNGTRIRGESHLLIVGDPGTGKSQFLKYASRLSPRYVMTNGIGTTSAGLTVMATKESGGDWTLEAGALVLADGGVCCIDEFDAIREHDRTTIHEAMEQQTLSIAKAGLVCKLNTRTTIFAACNPKGKYDLTASLSINCALASPLLSRFDIVLVLLDQKDDEWDKSVSRFILDENQVAPDETDEQLWDIEKMQSYISFVKNKFRPTIPAASGQILNRYYLLQRDRDQRVAARTTIRLLESLVRLAQAHARLMFRDQVTEQDAIMAVLAVDGSMHTSTILNIDSVLHSNFPDDPDYEYLEQRKIVLRHLGLLAHDGPSSGIKQTQKQTLTQRLTQRRALVQDDLVEEEEEEDQAEEEEENFAINPPAKRAKTSQKASGTQNIPRTTTVIPELDSLDYEALEDDTCDDQQRSDFENHMRNNRTSINKLTTSCAQLPTNIRFSQPSNTQVPKAPSFQPPSSQQASQQARTYPTPNSNPRASNMTSSTRTPAPPVNRPVTFVTPSPINGRSAEKADNSTLKTKGQDRAENSTSKPKKRSFAQLLMDSQQNKEDEDPSDVNPDEELDMFFGEVLFDDGTSPMTPTVTKRSQRYL